MPKLVPDVGDVARIFARIYAAPTADQQAGGERGAPVDPTSSTVKVTDPKGGVVSYTTIANPSMFTHFGTGEWSIDIPVTLPGTWATKWIAAGAVVAVETKTFVVNA